MRERFWAAALLVMAVTIATNPDRLAGQEPVRGYAMGDPLPGHSAPDFALPYARAEGMGPVDQPFSLRAELGRVVVLAFCPRPSNTAAVALLEGLAMRHDSLAAGEVVLATILPEPSDRLAARALDLGLPYKLLADSLDQVRRMYGVDQREVAVYVVGPRGDVVWREKTFNPFAAMSYVQLAQAVRRAGGGGSSR